MEKAPKDIIIKRAVRRSASGRRTAVGLVLEWTESVLTTERHHQALVYTTRRNAGVQVQVSYRESETRPDEDLILSAFGSRKALEPIIESMSPKEIVTEDQLRSSTGRAERIAVMITDKPPYSIYHVVGNYAARSA